MPILSLIIAFILGAVAWDFTRKKLIDFVNKNIGKLSGKKAEVIPPKME
jgi:hypothetical protein